MELEAQTSTEGSHVIDIEDEVEAEAEADV